MWSVELPSWGYPVSSKISRVRLTEAAKLRIVSCRYRSAPRRLTGFQIQLTI